MKKMNNKGFSLIELIIVIAIMAVLVAVIAPNLTGYIGKSKKNTDVSNADTMENVITNALQDFTTDSSVGFGLSSTGAAESTAPSTVDPATEAGKSDGYLVTASGSNVISMNSFIAACAQAYDGSAANSIYKSLSKYATGTGANTTINPKVTGNEFHILFEGSYDEGYTCKVQAFDKTSKPNPAKADFQ